MIAHHTTGRPPQSVEAVAAKAPAGRFLSFTVGMFMIATYLVTALPGLSRLPHLLIGMMLLGLVLRSIRVPLRLHWDVLVPMSVLFVAYAVASVLWSTDQSSALVSSVGLMVDMLGALLIWAALQNGVSALVVAYSAGAAAAVQAGIALVQYIGPGPSRAVGLTGNANSLAIQLSLTSFLLLLIIPKERWVKLLALALIVIATITTGTRKLVFVWFSYIVLLLRDVSPMFRRPSLGSALVLLLAPVAVWASLTFGPTLLSPLEEVTMIQRIEGTFQGKETNKRSGLMEDALVVWWQKPVFGHGIDQFRYVGSYTTYSHNNYTEVLANFGVVGLLLYYGIFLSLFVRAAVGASRGSQTAWVILGILVSVVLMDVARVSYSSRMTWIFVMIMALYSSGSQMLPSTVDRGASKPRP